MRHRGAQAPELTMPSTRTAPVVRGIGLSKAFGPTQALKDVSVEVKGGEVRALVGRNGAGKSTLVSLLTGLLEPDSGTLQFSEIPAPPVKARELWRSRVACVYQHPKVVPTLSCAENLFLVEIMAQRSLISWQRIRRDAQVLCDQWGLTIDVEQEAGSLTVGERQLLEIARALIQGSRLLILDEPTAKLQGKEVTRLFEHIRSLKLKGVGVLFISHHLDEIFEICDCVTVLRDGRRTLDRPLPCLERTELIEAMVGETGASLPKARTASAELSTSRIRLDVRDLRLEGAFDGVSLQVRAGECVGLAGLTGSGKEAVGEVLAGLKRFDAGTIRVDDTDLLGGDVSRHNRAGIGFVPQDRHAQGLVMDLSVAENATMAIADRLGALGFIRPRAQMRYARRLIQQLDIKASDCGGPVSDLSGGNQQKVVLARALARDPGVLVLINPTAGVDVASKAALFAAIRKVASRGAAALMISDELEELDLCDRVLVIRSHRMRGEFARPWVARDLVAAMEGIA
jgi:simple sugar transport system ATP-binding protein